jgi:excisionase family DNA binding protein
MGDSEPFSVSVKKAAALLGISDRHAYQMVKEGKLPGAYRMGRRILVHLETLRGGKCQAGTRLGGRRITRM